MTISPDSESVMSYRDALYQAMHRAILRPEVIILGQGADDHKGIFGTTSQLAEKFGRDRCSDTPLAEESIAGICIGAALNGLYPIQTHIRADFALLAMNQIVNLAAKYKYMFGGRFEVPLLIRMVVGRSWGQGAQHSQSLQSLFAHIPGLHVIMPAHPQRILEDYAYVIDHVRGPVISIEHRLMYDLQFTMTPPAYATAGSGLTSHLVREGRDVTIVATSIMVLEALRCAEHLSQSSDINCEIIDLNCLSHPDKELVISSVKKTGCLLVADTSWQAYGTGAEVCRWICESCPEVLRYPAVTLGMAPCPCPTAKSLEDIFYPNLHTLTDAAARLATGKRDHGIPLPNEQSMADVYKKFRGPF
jgi:acetoin:2,6-dichlorophenolindophenol oxidoreductase subunit beta